MVAPGVLAEGQRVLREHTATPVEQQELPAVVVPTVPVMWTARVTSTMPMVSASATQAHTPTEHMRIVAIHAADSLQNVVGTAKDSSVAWYIAATARPFRMMAGLLL